MNPTQLAILNSLVTYAAENVPGGLKDDEREVAKIVGLWCRNGDIYPAMPDVSRRDNILLGVPLGELQKANPAVDRFVRFGPPDADVKDMWKHDHTKGLHGVMVLPPEGTKGLHGLMVRTPEGFWDIHMPFLTPEELYDQDERKRRWDEREQQEREEWAERRRSSTSRT